MIQLKQWHKEELQLFREQLRVIRKEMVRSYSSSASLQAVCWLSYFCLFPKGQALDSFPKDLLEHQQQ
jgi:hypothetical protein